jgi:hypothetical protein
VARVGEQDERGAEELRVDVVLDQSVNNQQDGDLGVSGGVVDDPVEIPGPLGRGHEIVCKQQYYYQPGTIIIIISLFTVEKQGSGWQCLDRGLIQLEPGREKLEVTGAVFEIAGVGAGHENPSFGVEVREDPVEETVSFPGA